jgi:hypothetical protein
LLRNHLRSRILESIPLSIGVIVPVFASGSLKLRSGAGILEQPQLKRAAFCMLLLQGFERAKKGG